MSTEKKPKKEKEILLEFENQSRGKILSTVLFYAMLTNIEHCLESIVWQARRFRANISVRGRGVVVSDWSNHGSD